ncbi:DNA adenine methylase [Kingella kingae]|uniref:DNA adenine methylase n=2 Tax=Neisseriaceae TaxID=481 RepID=UPI00254F73C5|nr:MULTISPECIES: DNA adenine methylase [Kingella]MDK4545215.1 DNA adenine methylase [Kingella kingae]MDK4590094.1 DNA adenine methylase [Kingella kingae]MDK4613244.1 DNA adenine methylase [Kingella kingae]MDK4629022.1 DNA adenine methylase [Kingella kingae]MDK4636907.1 DNA adenine methylase [Kingella kingae]
MRYIGNKENLVSTIHQIMQERQISGQSFFDVFSGTTSVAKYFKRLNYQIYSCDLMYYSYVLQQASLANNLEPTFSQLLPHIDSQVHDLFASPLQNVLDYLNRLPEKKGFIYQHYTPDGSSHLPQPRMYYTGENGAFIDKVRQQIDIWREQNWLSESEFFILCAALIETVPFYANISGVYAAFHKTWDKRALKPMYLREPEIIVNQYDNVCFYGDSKDILANVQADIFYLDPPYNQRQYAPNYHLLETIAQYDNPEIKGVSGMRDYSQQKSRFCNVQTALDDLEYFAKNGKYRYLLLSYNSEGIMSQDAILEVLKPHGAMVEMVGFDYLRFKSNNNGDSRHKKYVQEQLYIVSK